MGLLIKTTYFVSGLPLGWWGCERFLMGALEPFSLIWGGLDQFGFIVNLRFGHKNKGFLPKRFRFIIVSTLDPEPECILGYLGVYPLTL